MIELLLYVFEIIAIYVVLTKISNYCQAKWGIQGRRNMYHVIGTIFVIYLAFGIHIGWGILLLTYMIAIYKLDNRLDKKYVKAYKELQLQLSKLNNSGWGTVPKANTMRTILANIWAKLPEPQRQKIIQWEEKELDSLLKQDKNLFAI